MADLLVVVGTRAGAVSAASVVDAAARHDLSYVTVASGRHCRLEGSSGFDVEIGLSRADVAAAEHDTALAAEVVSRFESELIVAHPSIVVSVGDDAVAAGCGEAAARGYPVARLEAGLRSGHRDDLDEVNRKRCDHVSSFLYVTGSAESENLRSEGVRPERIAHVGSTVCAAALRRRATRRPTVMEGIDGPCCVVTIGRPETIDDYVPLTRVVEAVVVLSRWVPVFFPMEEHTRQRLAAFQLDRVIQAEPGLRTCAALDYGEFGELLAASRLVLTDSGAVQEEAMARGIACLTVRETTERRSTLASQANCLVGTDTEQIVEQALAILEGAQRPYALPDLWDGLAGERIAASLSARLDRPAAAGSTGTGP